MVTTFPRFEYWATGLRWYWHLKARNGRIIATGGEAFASEHNVLRAIGDFYTEVMLAGPKEIVRVYPAPAIRLK